MIQDTRYQGADWVVIGCITCRSSGKKPRREVNLILSSKEGSISKESIKV